VVLPRSRSTFIVVLLVATLAMTAMLAYEAQQAARSHRATAENVLRDYAGFATWELSRIARQQLLNALSTEAQEVRDAADRGSLQSAVGFTGSCGSCGGVHRVLSAFESPLPQVRYRFAGAPIDPALQDLLQTTTANAMKDRENFTCPLLRVHNVGGTPILVVMRPVWQGKDPVRVVGFVTDTEFLSTLLTRLLKQSPLLPPALARSGANPNDALTVRVAAPDGARLFASAGEWSPYAAEQSLGKDLGALQLSVALKPDAAERLVIGGLPAARLPLIVGLLALTACLVVVALVQLRREAELARLRSDFVSGVSHELRTPLAQIRMFSETLLLGRIRSESEGRRSLEIIAREAQRLAQLVENVLFFARSERRQPRIAPEPSRLAPIVAEVVENFAPLAAARRARIVTDLDGAAAAKVDAGALRQILLNLLDNAIKYGPQGQTVTVVLKLADGCARLIVDDEGPGIEAEQAAAIWQPFHRLATANAAVGGAGIGLAIVRQLIDLHGGRAWVERGQSGARFVVEFPGAWSDRGAAAVA
jgi:signal transduction histidine kinase